MQELSTLNPNQKLAVKARSRAVLVLAGAGSGKTRVATLRIADLIQEEGAAASEILGLTFTNKASLEMRERVARWTNQEVLICTFHSLGARILRESISLIGYPRSFTIYDEDDLNKLLKECLTSLGRESTKSHLKNCRSWISKAKNRLKKAEEFSLADDPEMVPVYALYQQKLRSYGALDFDDLLFLTVTLLQEHPTLLHHYHIRWKHILVDEYQDTNHAQYTMTQLLVGTTGTLFVVGDPDQAIYSWRGANMKNILHFEKDYPGALVVRLDQNYRSTETILEAANSLIQHNKDRYEKKLWSNLGEGSKIRLFAGENERSEASFISTQIAAHKGKEGLSLKEMVVFYRTNAQSRAFEDELLFRRIPYKLVGGVSFYQRKEIKDILAFLRLAHSGADAIAFKRAIYLPKRGIGDAALEKLEEAAEQEQFTLLAYCEHLSLGHPLTHSVRLNSSQKSGLAEFITLIQTRHATAKQNSIAALVKEAIEKSGYLGLIRQDKETFEERKQNLDELIAKAIEWEELTTNPSLEAFLEELSLKSSLDEVSTEQESIQLMTIHNGKGLEFEVAFLAGLEEDLFPHVNSRDSQEKVEEERRLCYVGMTRAKRQLYLSYCRNRFLWGTVRSQRPSRFLKEIPEKYWEKWPQNDLKSTYSPSHSYVKERSERSLATNYVEGEAVFHPTFGVGQVREIFEGTLGQMIKVFFAKDRDVKTLVLRDAPLRSLK